MKIILSLSILIVLVGCAQKQQVAKRMAPPVREIAATPQIPKNEGWHDRAVQAYLKGDYSKAIPLFEAARAFDPQRDDVRGLYLLFYCYFATGDVEQASVLAREIVLQRPYHPLSYQQLGMVSLWKNDAKGALEHFRRAIEFDSHYPKIYFYMGLAHEKLGDIKARDFVFQKAEKEYRSILKANPEDLIANYELAALNLYAGRNTDSVGKLLRKANEGLSSVDEEELAMKTELTRNFYLPALEGILKFRQKNYPEATNLLSLALAQAPSGSKPDTAEILYYLGKVQAETGNLESARDFFARSQSFDPNGPYAQVSKSSERQVTGSISRDQ